ncbi:MAG: PaaI family thioesterase [Sneathiella sp.]
MPLAKTIGVDVVGLAPGSAILRMAFKTETTFDGAGLMGGIAGTFADMAAVSAAVAERGSDWLGSTTHFTTNLIAPGLGDIYIANGKTVGSSGSTTTATAKVFAIKNNKAQIIASCMASARMIQIQKI